MSSYKCCTSDRREETQLTTLTSLLKLVGEESRLKLLCVLSRGSHCVCEMKGHLSLSQSLISHHLSDLKEAGMVKDEKKGLRVYYSLTEKGKRITHLLFKL